MNDSLLETANTALLVIDVQGKLATLMHDRESYLTNLKIMIRSAKILGLPILWAEQLPDKLGATLPEISELLAPASPVIKSTFSCSGSAEFNTALAEIGRDTLLVTGIETHICVYQTVFDLLKKGLNAQVVCDAVSSRYEYNKQLGLKKMEQAGAQITSTETCLFELMKQTGTPEFKQITTLLK